MFYTKLRYFVSTYLQMKYSSQIMQKLKSTRKLFFNENTSKLNNYNSTYSTIFLYLINVILFARQNNGVIL